MGRRRETNQAEVTTTAAEFGGVRVVIATNRGRVLLKGDKSKVDAETRDRATRWVISTLRQNGWAIPDPLGVRDALWSGVTPPTSGA